MIVSFVLIQINILYLCKGMCLNDSILLSQFTNLIPHLQVCASWLHFGLRRVWLGLHNEHKCPEHVPDVQGFPAEGDLWPLYKSFTAASPAAETMKDTLL